MNALQWIWGTLAVFWVSTALAQPTTPTVQPVAGVQQTTMPDHVHDLLSRAINGYKFREETDRRKSLDALETLKNANWPDPTKLTWAELEWKWNVDDQATPDRPYPRQRTWQLAQIDGSVLLVRPDLSSAKIDAVRVIKITPADFGKDLTAFVDGLKKKDDDRRPWEFTFFQDHGAGGLPYYGGVFYVHQAVWAAWLGQDSEATQLLNAALEQRDDVIVWAIEERGWQGLRRGIESLEEMSPRAEVLAQWEQALADSPTSSYAAQLKDLITELRLQVKVDEKAGKQIEVDPEKLNSKDRIAWYVERLGDVHGQQWSQPGMCRTTGMGKDTRYSDALVSIGRPAVPALIGLLEDTRLTRSIGYWRDFDPHRIVLRYQDVAIECIEKILDIPFYDRSSSSSYLSTEKPEVRLKVIADIKAWWKKNGLKSQVEGLLARLETGNAWERLNTLVKIEKLNPAAVDSVATIKRWAETAEPGEVPTLADALAERKDLSLLPRVRKLVFEDKESDHSQGVWFLMKYGQVEDFVRLRATARAERNSGEKNRPTRVLGSVRGGLESSTRTEVVPLMIDCLSDREMTGSRYESRFKSKQSVSYSTADIAIEALMRMTGHEEGYVPDAPVEERSAAFDRWVVWWNREGKKTYVEKHPEIAPILADNPKDEPTTIHH